MEPADFLEKRDPKVTTVFSEKSVNPNGLYPARDGSLLMVGFMSADPGGAVAPAIAAAHRAARTLLPVDRDPRTSAGLG